MTKIEQGVLGENIAREYFEKLGFSFLASNFRTRFGEIDLIYMDRENLVLVEVKMRNKNKIQEIEYTINKTKINRILKTAEIYIEKNRDLKFDEIRIDALLIENGESDTQVKYYKNYL